MKTIGSIVWRCREREIRIGTRPLVMGILNVTPDSFSDGGRYPTIDEAVRHGIEMAAQGADMVDVGGESTRPGADPVSAPEELARVIPVIRELARAFESKSGAPVISVDTRKAVVAAAALEVGAGIVNDVTALAGDSGMPAVAAQYGAGVILMHMRGEPATMQREPQYADVAAEVGAYLAGRMTALLTAGLALETMAFDPGIGFGKMVEHNLELVAGVSRWAPAGRPVVLGVSRKQFIGRVTGREVADRLAGSLACAVWGATRGAHVWRVHDVKESVEAARMVAALNKETAAWIG
ncbi:MAG: dihydropteroate synthase [bacterium]